MLERRVSNELGNVAKSKTLERHVKDLQTDLDRLAEIESSQSLIEHKYIGMKPLLEKLDQEVRKLKEKYTQAPFQEKLAYLDGLLNSYRSMLEGYEKNIKQHNPDLE